ncbi:NAD(P)H-binding protein [Lentilactobacillus sp. Marseille-Q4993]|uniref:NAD(P)H-binding protein n=1 Tax=Lentilactobacillus sp. Marseille-Q4993 TaxID=3039492 RepID=UPI0024BC1990|nr:NAD(P)H-binding protein [Lentilactobacillus sp. Marseille-Q4993]
MKYGITRATGHFGTFATNYLATKVDPSDIIAIVRDPKKAENKLPAGIGIHQSTYENIADLTNAFEGIDKLLFISSVPGGKIARQNQHHNVIEAAKQAGVKFIAYTSFPQAENANTPLAADHVATEKMLADSGIAHSNLRNNWYLENETSFLVAGSKAQTINYSAKDGKAGWALEREYAEAAINVLLKDAPKPIYEFAGNSRNYPELFTGIKAAFGTDFKVNQVTDDEYKQGLINAGIDEGTAGFITMTQTLIREGNLDENTNDLTDILGHDLTPLPNAIREVLSE